MQGLSAKDTIISPKRKHCTVQFKNVALISGQNLTKWLLGALEIVCVCKPFNKDLSYSKEIPCPFTWSLSSRISKVKGGLLTRDETVQMGWDRACRSSPSPFILNRTESFKLSIWLKGVILDTLWSQFIATFSATSQKVLSLRRRNFFSGYGNSAD